MKKHWKSWTPEEDAVLREVWMGEKALRFSLDLFPGRTFVAVKMRGQRLGLPDRNEFMDTKKSSWVECRLDQELAKHVDASAEEIAKYGSLNQSSLRIVLRKGHGTKYFISSWQKRANGGDWTARWALGAKPDAERPRPQTNTEIHRRFRARQKLKKGNYNPFAAALGLVSAPEAQTGRVYRHMDDREAA
jgi:hypothetical protein